MPPPPALPPRIVLYDGICGLCDAAVQWLLARDPEGRLHFAPLQGTTAQQILQRHPELPEGTDSILFIEQEGDAERLTWRSRALIRIARQLQGPSRHLALLRFVPSFISDLGYRFVARIRYRIWGRRAACRVPSPDERARFLD